MFVRLLKPLKYVYLYYLSKHVVFVQLLRLCGVYFCVLLTVHLSIILVTDQLNAQILVS